MGNHITFSQISVPKPVATSSIYNHNTETTTDTYKILSLPPPSFSSSSSKVSYYQYTTAIKMTMNETTNKIDAKTINPSKVSVFGTTSATPSDDQNNDWIWVAVGTSLTAFIIIVLVIVCCFFKCRNSSDDDDDIEEERDEYEENL